jgi:maleylpyruvate isomerase
MIDVDLQRLDDDASYEQAIGLLADLTDRLLDDVRSMDDDAVRAPSTNPGWTRGHVLTHLARNADGLCKLLGWARTGEKTPMYASREVRDADIEAGAGRSASEQEADLESSSERLLAGLAALPVDRRHVMVRSGGGEEVPAHDVVWFRIREVAYHHVDLRTGVRFADLPDPVIARGLPEAVQRVGLDPVERGVRGSDADLLGWLTGRESGERLDAGGPLPSLPPWG